MLYLSPKIPKIKLEIPPIKAPDNKKIDIARPDSWAGNSVSNIDIHGPYHISAKTYEKAYKEILQ